MRQVAGSAQCVSSRISPIDARSREPPAQRFLTLEIVGGGVGHGLDRILSIFSELLSRVDRSGLSAKDLNGQKQSKFVRSGVVHPRARFSVGFCCPCSSAVGESEQTVGTTSTRRSGESSKPICRSERVDQSTWCSRRRLAPLEWRDFESSGDKTRIRRPIDAG